jgi:hypothetical protein
VIPRDYHGMYVRLGRLLETAPDAGDWTRLQQTAAHQWFGRAHAILEEAGLGSEAISYRVAMDTLTTSAWKSGLSKIFQILYRALAHLETQVPHAAAGSFIPVGSSFDAFAALSKLLQGARTDVLIVDPYMDETALTEFGLAVPEAVTLRLLADEASYKPTMEPAARKWAAQYGRQRPLEARLAHPKALHDRAIFVDHKDAWTLTQSLKDFAKRSPAEIVRADDTAVLKIEAYAAIWNAAKVLV